MDTENTATHQPLKANLAQHRLEKLHARVASKGDPLKHKMHHRELNKSYEKNSSSKLNGTGLDGEQRFYTWFIRVMAAKGASRADVAKLLGCTERLIQFWIMGQGLPRGPKLVKLAEWAGVAWPTLQVLVNRSRADARRALAATRGGRPGRRARVGVQAQAPVPGQTKHRTGPAGTFGTWLGAQFIEKGESKIVLATRLGTSRSLIDFWIRGLSMPRMAKHIDGLSKWAGLTVLDIEQMLKSSKRQVANNAHNYPPYANKRKSRPESAEPELGDEEEVEQMQPIAVKQVKVKQRPAIATMAAPERISERVCQMVDLLMGERVELQRIMDCYTTATRMIADADASAAQPATARIYVRATIDE